VVVEVVDEGGLTAPCHLGTPARVILDSPGTPHRGLLLGDAEQDHPSLAAFLRCRLDQGSGVELLVLALLKMVLRDASLLGPAPDFAQVCFADLPEAADDGIGKPR